MEVSPRNTGSSDPQECIAEQAVVLGRSARGNHSPAPTTGLEYDSSESPLVRAVTYSLVFELRAESNESVINAPRLSDKECQRALARVSDDDQSLQTIAGGHYPEMRCE